TPMEKLLAGIWAEVLGIEQVGRDEDFFDLGGHSLLATQLAARLRRDLEMDFPLRALFAEPTVAGLARKITYSVKTGKYLYHEEALKWASLVPMQARGDRPPFFLVSGTYSAEDEFLGYMANLVPHLGTDQPVFGFKARGLDGTDLPHSSAEEMARDYLEELRAYQPKGPYLLGGECVGGVVAFEMARQLQTQGEKVALLLLMDTICPSWKSAFLFHLDFLGRKLRSIFRHICGILQWNWKGGRAHLIKLIRRKRQLHIPLNQEERVQGQIYRIERTYSRLMFRYRPEAYLEKVTLLVNEQSFRRNPTLGWEKIVGEHLTVHVVPGNHLTRITDHVRVTAERIRACIDKACAKDILRQEGSGNVS
ncbi:MAG: thioesterase domain-containing protein, partial [Planctomycetota bacterium]